MKEIKNVESALQLFEVAALEYVTATEVGDSNASNNSYKKLKSVVEYLKSTNELAVLEKLLDHSSVGVRIWSASFLLPVLEKKAIRALEAISEASDCGIHSFDAQMTLSEWREGNMSR